MSLEVPATVAEQVLAAAQAAYPEECCGLLIGPVPDGFEKPGRLVQVQEARALDNGWESPARDRRYQIDPKAYAAVERELSGSGLGVVGFYHSHPDVPAWPSPFDLERAWPCYSYWIVSVRRGQVQGSRSWMRSEDGRGFMEEEVFVKRNDSAPPTGNWRGREPLRGEKP